MQRSTTRKPFCQEQFLPVSVSLWEGEAESTQRASTGKPGSHAQYHAVESPCHPGHVSPGQAGVTPHSYLPPATGLPRNSATRDIKIKPNTLGGK